MRHFRLSQLANDAFDAYRASFLALEAILDDLAPPGAPAGERPWLEFALERVPAAYSLDLGRYLLDPSAADPVQGFMFEQWTARRCATFHAKRQAKGALLPGVAEDRRVVADAIEPLQRLVIDLCREAFDARFPAGGMTTDGFSLAMENLSAHGYTIAVLDDGRAAEQLSRSELEPIRSRAEEAAHLGRTDKVGLEHGYVADFGDLGDASIVGAVVSYAATPMAPGLLTVPPKNGLLSAHALPQLDLHGAARVQVEIRWVLDNQKLPRARFSL